MAQTQIVRACGTPWSVEPTPGFFPDFSHANDHCFDSTTRSRLCRPGYGRRQARWATAGRGHPGETRGAPGGWRKREIRGRPPTKKQSSAASMLLASCIDANAEGLAELFMDDASIVDPDGNTTRGKAAVAEMYATAFQATPGLKVETKVDEMNFLTPDVRGCKDNRNSRPPRAMPLNSTSSVSSWSARRQVADRRDSRVCGSPGRHLTL